MILSINSESIITLREYANVIRDVVNNMHDDIIDLISVFNNLNEVAGPHEEQFNDMLLKINRFQEVSSDSIEELSYMLIATAEKMETYLGKTVSSFTKSIKLGDDSIAKFNNAISERLTCDSIDKHAKELYINNKSKIRILDHNYTGTPFYNMELKGICMNYLADLHNPAGSLATYFHEVGHLIDHDANSKGSFISDDEEYLSCLRQDVHNYICKTKRQYSCDINEAFDIISDELWGDCFAGVSDIFGSLTECKCQGNWGHHPLYWKRSEDLITKEAFANMFEAAMSTSKKQEIMMNYFPTAFNRFKNLIGG